MKVIIDIEANALVNPTEIWLIVCKDIATGEYSIFRNVTSNVSERNRFLQFAERVDTWIGHNILGYDAIVIHSLLLVDITDKCLDTLILSKLIDYPRKGHSIESYGEEFGVEKGSFSKWNDPSLYDVCSPLYKQLEEYCVRDVDICLKVYLKYLKYLSNPLHISSIVLEHKFQLIVNDLSTNGFKFNISKALGLLTKVTGELALLDEEIAKAFPPKYKLIREITPRVTKHGTLNRNDFRWLDSGGNNGDLSDYNGGPFCLIDRTYFNPSSHRQIVQVLADAGWVPTDKTTTHVKLEQEINRQKYGRGCKEDLSELEEKLIALTKTGWKVNEQNLSTLPDSAPAPARFLAKRIMLESRRRTLTEWLNLVQDDGRIHGKFYGIGAWTHRMAHQAPNTANIPNEFDTEGKVKLLGKEMRQLWQAPKNRLLVGVDAEGIQLRIFAHYIDDAEFTEALVKGDKKDGTDPHSLNQRILGPVCNTRAAAKRFIYALLLGAGISKLAQVLATSEDEARRALDRLMDRYEGFAKLKATIVPADARRGWFVGLDGRRVAIPGETPGERKHLCMSGYLQNGEAIVVKDTAVKVSPLLRAMHSSIKLVNIVHDEYVIEVPNNVSLAEEVKGLVCSTITKVGKDLKLKCPLAGDGGYGLSWYEIH